MGITSLPRVRGGQDVVRNEMHRAIRKPALKVDRRAANELQAAIMPTVRTASLSERIVGNTLEKTFTVLLVLSETRR
jgi:hypothetical protein